MLCHDVDVVFGDDAYNGYTMLQLLLLPTTSSSFDRQTFGSRILGRRRDGNYWEHFAVHSFLTQHTPEIDPPTTIYVLCVRMDG